MTNCKTIDCHYAHTFNECEKACMTRGISYVVSLNKFTRKQMELLEEANNRIAKQQEEDEYEIPAVDFESIAAHEIYSIPEEDDKGSTTPVWMSLAEKERENEMKGTAYDFTGDMQVVGLKCCNGDKWCKPYYATWDEEGTICIGCAKDVNCESCKRNVVEHLKTSMKNYEPGSLTSAATEFRIMRNID
jgi:hypothetical protein